MHVCLLTTCFPRFEGDHAGVFVSSLAKSLISAGVDVTVVTPHSPGVPRRRRVGGIDVHRFLYAFPPGRQKLAYSAGIPDNLQKNKWVMLQAPALLAAGAAKMLQVAPKVDVIHAFWTPSATMAAPAVWMHRKPMLTALLGDGIRLAPRIANRVALRASSALVCSTAELEEYLKPYRYRRPVYDIKQVPDMRRLDDTTPLEDELARWCAQAGAIVTFIGRLVDFKDPLGLIEAVPRVLAEHPKTRFLIVGDGPLRDRMEKRVGELRAGESVRLTGERNDVGAILRASTLFVANSPVTNCYSTVIQEAMTLSVPCVLTDVGDPRGSYRWKDYVQPVRPRDPQDLARGINHLLADGKLRERRSRLGHEFLADMGFTAQAVLDQTMEVYELLHRFRGRIPPGCESPSLRRI